ncbi:OmpA family protein [Flavobacterium amniphilum]|uniref:OmpA family protein n=1 Tax=Flavobacterium amniphilum TaxID=1834035 RepID=UPI00202A345C|nr:OmpA family protein [Flavobacterium amniphilum]MCL9805662.1 OmpA family protein [Flavobacterium amniphilum]
MRKALTLSLVLFTSIFYGQQKLKAADEMFNDMSYVEASKLYEEYLEKNPDLSTQTISNIADTYYNLNDMRKALTWYQKLYDIQGQQNLSELYLLRYTQALRSVRDYDKANAITKEMLKRKNDNSASRYFTFNQKHLDSLAQKGSLYQIRNLDVNSPNSDFGTAFYGNKLVYSSAKEVAGVDKKIYSWNEQPYLTMYVADRNLSDGTLTNEQPFLTEIASKYHDATVSFSEDLKTFYYTTNTLKGNTNKLKNDKQGVNNFQIIKSDLENEKVAKSEKLFFNSLEYSVGHPALSPDGKWLFFVSDMPGGFGETDIYMVEVFPDGKTSSPKNLGPKINTIGREMFPFYNEGKFYFSSEGHYGFGGLDIFESKFNGRDFSDPKNLGEPVNSNKDDFSFIIEPKSKYGYFSSNRDTGKGDDDIYYFTKKAPDCYEFVAGSVVNAKSKEALHEVSVKVLDSFGDLKQEGFTDVSGKYEIKNPCNGTYKFIASKPGYSTLEKEVVLGSKDGDVHKIDFELGKLEDFVVKDNGNEKIDINPIFFDYDKWDITSQAATELDKVVYVMTNFPKVKIRIESHTDSRGKDLYNLKLSDNRAKSTQTYILSKGISADRIESAVGFGETRLKNKCKNGVKCSEEEHFGNRRSDFIIVEK